MLNEANNKENVANFITFTVTFWLFNLWWDHRFVDPKLSMVIRHIYLILFFLRTKQVGVFKIGVVK